MKVCVTGLRGMPGVMGGVETHCEELLPRIAERADDIQLEVCARRPYQPLDVTRVGKVAIVSLPSPRGRSSEAIISTLHGVIHAWSSRADVVHIHAIGPALMIPLARLLGLRVVLTHHGEDYRRAKWGFVARTMLRLGETIGMAGAHRIICVSPSLREAMARHYPRAAHKLVYVPNGSSAMPQLDTTDSVYLEKLGLEPGRYVLNAARLVPEKGQDYLIEAHARSGSPYPLVLAGAAHHGDAYALKLAGMASAEARLIGQVTRAQLGALYRNAALFVLPSYHEGLPIAALEAMSCGTPMLLSDIAANRDLGLHERHYATTGSVDSWAAALGGDLDRYRLDGNSSNADFDWNSIATSTLSVYRSVSIRPAR